MTTGPDDDRVRLTLLDADSLVQQHLIVDISAGLADLDRRQRRRLRPQRRTSQHMPPLVMTRSPECTADGDLANDAAAQGWPQRQSWVDTEHRPPEPLHRVGEDLLLHDRDLAEGPGTQDWRQLPGDIAELLPVSRARQQTRVRRTRRILAAALAICLVGVGAATWQARTAQRTAQQAELSRKLAAQSAALLSLTPDVAALLAVYAYRSSPTTAAVDSLNNVVAQPLARTLTRHTGRVYALAYSPDGTHLAGGGWRGTVRVWDLATGTSRTLTGHTGKVYGVAYSPDGKHLASTSDDGTVRVWDLATGTSRTLTGHTAWAKSVAYSPDGTHLASTSDDGTVRVWDLGSGTSRTLTGHTGPVYAVAYSPDGRHLASAGLDQTVRIWDLGSGTSRTLTGHTGPVSAVAYSPDGTHLVGGGLRRGTVWVWDLATGTARTLTGHTGPVWTVAYTPDGTRLATASDDGKVRVWDLAAGRSRTLTADNGPVYGVAYSPDGKHLASADAGEAVTDWAWAPTGMAPPQMIGFICGQLRHDLTPEERARYLPSADSAQPACPSTR